MNILVEPLPTAVEIAGKEYEIDTDFRTCLKVIMAFEDLDLTPQEKRLVLLNLLYPRMPQDVEQAFTKANLFLNGGQVKDDDEHEHSMRLFSFTKDANLIFAAFRQTNGVDLQTADLHWWTFLALFMDLGQETTFCQLIALRKRLKTGKASSEERQAAREMMALIDLPELDDRTLDEREAEADFLRKVEQHRQAAQGVK